jgi:ABC-2 type transport system ATP-binding protein
MDVLLKFRNLQKRFGRKVIFKDINIEINKGELYGFIGMSGSGKTTLLNTIIGFLTPDYGDLLFYSFDDNIYKSVYKNPQEVKRNFGFATQVPSFYPKLTIKENMHYFGRLHKLSNSTIKSNSEKLLGLIDLKDDQHKLAQDISEGMKKRLDIACSIIHNPRVVLMDEPTADLDPVLRRETWKLIKGILKMGTTVIVASHILSELEAASDRLSMIHNSKIIATGTPDQLKRTYSHKKQEIHLETLPGKYDSIARKLGGYKRLRLDTMKIRDGKLIIRTNDAESTLHHLLHIVEHSREKIINVDIKRPSLVEVFESLYKKEEEHAKHH